MPDTPNSPRTAEEKLAETQQKLAEAEKQLAQTQKALEKSQKAAPQPRKRYIEGIYDKINIPVKYVDYFIIAVVIAFVAVVAVGILKGRGIL